MPTDCLASSGSQAGGVTSRRRCRGASSSARRSRWPSRTIRRCSSRTNRPPSWTARRPRGSSTCSATSAGSWGPRSSWRPTTCSRRGAPTGWSTCATAGSVIRGSRSRRWERMERCSSRGTSRSASPTRSSRPTSRRMRSSSAAGWSAAVTDPEPLVRAVGVSRIYPGTVEVAAVRHASLELRPRDFTLLMGPSGSGKTSFLGMLAGFDPPDEGEVRWRETPFTRLTRDELLAVRRTGMSVIFQSYGLLPSLTAVENVELPLRIGGTGPDEARTRATSWLERLDLGHRLDHRTFELSGGQQQRVAVARALVVEPEVILADEPIAEVDSENADLILSALWEVVVRDGAVLAATHNAEALRYASRVLLFRDGVIEAEGSPDEVAAQLTTD